MKIVVGLGNPGDKYQRTRHNAGFMALDFVAQEIHIDDEHHKFLSVIKEGRSDGPQGPEKFLLVYPQTFMNDSGDAVKEILSFYKLSPADILVLHDEIDLPLGQIRFTDDSGSAGHNGVKSLIEKLGTQQFKRIRIGIESRPADSQTPTDAFVLQEFTPDELEKIPFQDIKHKVSEILR